jgi:hypothetical protein
MDIKVSNAFGQVTQQYNFDDAALINTKIENPTGIYFIKTDTIEGKFAVLKVLKK